MAEEPGREIPYKVAQTDAEKAIVNRDNTVRNCPVCNNGDLSRIHQIGRYAGLNRVFCDTCGAVYFALPLPATLFYGPQYNRFLWNPEDMIAAIKFAKQILELCQMFTGQLKGLEIGPGSGFTLQALSLWGLDFEGIEIDKAWAKELMYKMNIQVFSGGFLNFIPAYRYNLICGSHVIEHFEDAHAFWIKLNSLLKIHGLVILTAPDLDQSNNFHPQWYHFRTRHPWEHACLYGYRTLEFAAHVHGFQLIKFERLYEGNNWLAILCKKISITQKGAELDRTEDSPPFKLSSM